MTTEKGIPAFLMVLSRVELAAHEVLVIVSHYKMDLSIRTGDSCNACADASMCPRVRVERAC